MVDVCKENVETDMSLSVPAWGGTANLGGNIVIKLINTCPIDNYLTIFYLYLKEHQNVLESLKTSSAEYAKRLVQIVLAFERRDFATGKVIWLKQFGNFDFSTSGTVDVWGCELDMVMPCLAPILSSTLQMSCDTIDCPQKERSIQCKSIFITAPSRTKTATRSFLQDVFNDWLSPPPQPCNAVLDNHTAPEISSEVIEQFVAPEHQSELCTGTLQSQTRVFSNAHPWVLPIFFGA